MYNLNQVFSNIFLPLWLEFFFFWKFPIHHIIPVSLLDQIHHRFLLLKAFILNLSIHSLLFLLLHLRFHFLFFRRILVFWLFLLIYFRFVNILPTRFSVFQLPFFEDFLTFFSKYHLHFNIYDEQIVEVPLQAD